jgi:hypothetical protein
MSVATRNPKFEPIYRAIQDGDYNTALKLSEKRDFEKSQLGKALKALIIERFGQREEALGAATDILVRLSRATALWLVQHDFFTPRLCLQRAKPTDYQVLHAIGTVFSRCEDFGHMIQVHRPPKVID